MRTCRHSPSLVCSGQGAGGKQRHRFQTGGGNCRQLTRDRFPTRWTSPFSVPSLKPACADRLAFMGRRSGAKSANWLATASPLPLQSRPSRMDSCPFAPHMSSRSTTCGATPRVVSVELGVQAFLAQGHGNTRACVKNLRPPEVTALVAFLTTLHPDR